MRERLIRFKTIKCWKNWEIKLVITFYNPETIKLKNSSSLKKLRRKRLVNCGNERSVKRNENTIWKVRNWEGVDCWIIYHISIKYKYVNWKTKIRKAATNWRSDTSKSLANIRTWLQST
jgi:hypothetical protein